jgi:hypothetical protein
MLCFTQARTLSSGKRWHTIRLTGASAARAEVHHRDVVSAVRAGRPRVLELEDGHSSDPQHEPDARLVEFLDAGDLVHLVFRSGAECLDHPEARSFRSSTRGCRAGQFPLDVSMGCQAR